MRHRLSNEKERSLLAELKPFVHQFRKGDTASDGMFSLCLRAAISKAFEFATLAFRKTLGGPPFSQIATLRGICEDLIVLNFLRTVSEPSRNAILQALFKYELYDALACQDKFFKEHRVHQPVLGLSPDKQKLRKEATSILQSLWAPLGFTLSGNKAMPQTRQLAESGQVIVLYDFLYKLTSKLVHFNPQSLFRSGWAKDPSKPTYSFRNFSIYYQTIAEVYGLFLLSLYFELFETELNADAKTIKAASALRKELLLRLRWPELVTWEEMNLVPPNNGKAKIMDFVYMTMVSETKTRLLDPDAVGLKTLKSNPPKNNSAAKTTK
jgi:hypothetical protein